MNESSTSPLTLNSSSSMSSKVRESRLQYWRIATFIFTLSLLNYLSESRNMPSAFNKMKEDFVREEQNLTASFTLESNEETEAPTKPPKTIPLAEFVPPKTQFMCPPDSEPAPIVVNPEADAGLDRKIPKIVHMTGKAGCLTKELKDAVQQWTFEDHSFYFHDDRAVDELLNRDWPAFPQLKNSMHCLENAGGAAKADLWRYLALWEYGGIYTDLDNLPGDYFNASTITPDMDAFFLQEAGGWISQYFFAISPHHPLMFLAVHDVMQEMHMLEDTGNFYVPAKTGPGATKRAFLRFMGVDSQSSEQDVKFYSKPRPDLYYGKVNGNRTVLVEGSRQTSGQWVQRSAIRGGAKKKGFALMNITDYQSVNKKADGRTCLMKIHDLHMQEQEVVAELQRRRW